jgi:2-amino-4-hydroxy-6-hydroxymethyldihydropteridine diphosphokinase/dihydropteroate synthase
MKAVHQGFIARGRILSSRNVSFSRRFNAAIRISTSMASTRHQSSAIDRVKASPWSQHLLKVSAPHKNDPKFLSKSNVAKRKAYVALGSNLGDRIGWIEKACNEMSARGIKITRTSSLWETEPMYVLDQHSFINGACEVSCVCLFLECISRPFCPCTHQQETDSIPMIFKACPCSGIPYLE